MDDDKRNNKIGRRPTDIEHYSDHLQLHVILNNIDIGIYLIGADHKLSYLNPKLKGVFGITKGQESDVLGTPLMEVIETLILSDKEEYKKHRDRSYSGESGKYDIHMRTFDGNEVWLGCAYWPILDEETGEFRGTVGVLKDITRDKKLVEDLESLANDNVEE